MILQEDQHGDVKSCIQDVWQQLANSISETNLAKYVALGFFYVFIYKI